MELKAGLRTDFISKTSFTKVFITAKLNKNLALIKILRI